MLRTKLRFWKFIDQLIADFPIIIDRPKGWAHPRYSSVVYPVDYGYLQGTTSMDGEGIDVWRGSKTGSGVTGIFCTVDILKKDSEIKLIIDCSEAEINEIEKMLTSDYMQCILIKRTSSRGYP